MDYVTISIENYARRSLNTCLYGVEIATCIALLHMLGGHNALNLINCNYTVYQLAAVTLMLIEELMSNQFSIQDSMLGFQLCTSQLLSLIHI